MLSIIFARRHDGLRVNGLRDADDAKVFDADDQFVTDGRAPGIAAEMDGGGWWWAAAPWRPNKKIDAYAMRVQLMVNSH